MSVRRSWDLRLKKPRPVLLVFCVTTLTPLRNKFKKFFELIEIEIDIEIVFFLFFCFFVFLVSHLRLSQRIDDPLEG